MINENKEVSSHCVTLLMYDTNTAALCLKLSVCISPQHEPERQI